jgi:O-antigen ligase
MKRLTSLAVPVGLAVVVAAGAARPLWAAAAGAAAAVTALLFWAPPVLMLTVPIVVVQVLGEGLVLPGMPLGVAQLGYLLIIAVVLLRRSEYLPRLTGPLDRGMAALVLVSAVATVVGVFGGHEAAAIKDDVVSVIFLVVTYVATRTLVRTTREFDIVLAAILFGSFLAALKLAYLVVTPVPVGWTGPWQAVRLQLFGIPRVVLRGADVFFVVSTLIVVARAMSKGRVTLGAGVAGVFSLAGLAISATRSNWIGFCVGLLTFVVAGPVRAHVRVRRVAAGLAGCALIAVIGLALFPTVQRFAERMADAAGARQWTVTFRLLESQGVLTAIGSVYGLGNGMGSTYTFWDIERSVMQRTTWTHNAYLQWLMKTGVVGLLLFLVLMAGAGRMASRLIRARHPWAPGLLGMLGGLVAVLVLSVTVNKVFEFSGAMFLGLALGVIQSAEDVEVNR